MRVEIRRMNGGTWVKLDEGLAVVPISLIDEFRETWRGLIAAAIEKGEAVVNVGLGSERDDDANRD
jgi:hypothetical protein